MIDATYRTLSDKDHRAMAGLSMGGGQTLQITLAHPDKFLLDRLVQRSAARRAGFEDGLLGRVRRPGRVQQEGPPAVVRSGHGRRAHAERGAGHAR